MTLRKFGRLLGVVAGACLLAAAAPPAVASDNACGGLVTLAAHDRTTMLYSLAGESGSASAAAVLLPGGGGHLALDGAGCPEQLRGSSLVRMRALFHMAGIVTALVDAPSDHHEADGLGGFRIEPAHAEDIGKVIADLRGRTGLPVWLIGTSRGSISAANAASRLRGPAAPDGVVLTSPLTSGNEFGRKAWVAQTVFSVPLPDIRMPVLVVAHQADGCIRTPPAMAPRIVEATDGAREQAVTVSGGPGWDGGESVAACSGRAPHGFVQQEAEVVAGIVRFVKGGRY